MSDPRRPSLFDLPLEEPPEESPPKARPEEGAAGRAEDHLPLFSSTEAERPVPEPPPRADEFRTEGPRRGAPVSASVASRFVSGALDLGLHLGLGLALLGGAWFLGARPASFESLGIVVFLLVFSFLYTTIPLAFWGQTPGMQRAGIVAHSGEEGALTFGQTALRWIGSLVTLALAGLPSLLAAAGGRSLSDRLSGSRCWRA